MITDWIYWWFNDSNVPAGEWWLRLSIIAVFAGLVVAAIDYFWYRVPEMFYRVPVMFVAFVTIVVFLVPLVLWPLFWALGL